MNDNLNHHGLQFEPSAATKKHALAVRHADYRAGSLKAPGLFGISALATDTALFFVAVLLELLGFGAMHLFANASLLLLGLGIVFDITLGVFAHWPLGKLCLLENEELAATSLNKQAHFAVQARFYRGVRLLGVTLLWCFAMVKAYLLWQAYESLDLISGALMLFYAITALIHQHCTGYAFAGWRMQRALGKEFDAYTQNETTSSFRFDDAMRTPHSIAGVLTTPAVRHTLTPTHLITSGLLLDRDVTTLVGAQPSQIQEAVGKLCLAVQLIQLRSEPVRRHGQQSQLAPAAGGSLQPAAPLGQPRASVPAE